MAVSIDTVLFVFLAIIVLESSYHYSYSLEQRNNEDNTLFASFNTLLTGSLPYLFMALAAFVVNYPDRTWTILLIGGGAWLFALTNRVGSVDLNDSSDLESAEPGFKDVALNVAAPLAYGALFAVPYVYIKTMQM